MTSLMEAIWLFRWLLVERIIFFFVHLISAQLLNNVHHVQDFFFLVVELTH